MVMTLEHDEHVRLLLKIAPLRVGAREMDLQHAKR